MLEGRISMEVIAQESSRMASERGLRDDSNTTELLVQAYQRIRALQVENDELLAQLARSQHNTEVTALRQQVESQKEALREKDLKIANLERINEKAILDFICLENQLKVMQGGTSPHRRHVTPIPSELNSPLGLSKINRRQEQEEADEEAVSAHLGREVLRQQERLALNHRQDKWAQHELFTFDKENIQRAKKSPQPSKTLKNCFSEVQVKQLIKKVQRQQQKSQEKQRLKHYHNYCSSIQRKYSPNTAARKQPPQLKKSPLIIKTPSYFPSHTPYLQKGYCDKWGETATTDMSAASNNFFTGANRLNFY